MKCMLFGDLLFFLVSQGYHSTAANKIMLTMSYILSYVIIC
jgi:hypothetical protein